MLSFKNDPHFRQNCHEGYYVLPIDYFFFVSCHNDSLVISLVYGSFEGVLVILVFGISQSLREICLKLKF